MLSCFDTDHNCDRQNCYNVILRLCSKMNEDMTNVDFASRSVRTDVIVASEVVEIPDVPGSGGDGQ